VNRLRAWFEGAYPRAGRSSRETSAAWRQPLLNGVLLAGANRGKADSLGHSREKHLADIKQLTFGGENAEAYFSRDERRLIFQSTRDGFPCDQIYIMNVDGGGVHRVSTGTGRTTCSYFFPAISR